MIGIKNETTGQTEGNSVFAVVKFLTIGFLLRGEIDEKAVSG